MDWKPARGLKKPIYKQLAEFIEKGIADGSLSPESPLPSERLLAKELQINRSTVVAAYDELESNGLITRTRGSGTTISKDIWGLSNKRVPSWNRYIEAGSFMPSLPINQRIRKEMTKHKLINLASGELSEDLFPKQALRDITSTRFFIGSLGYDHPQGNIALRETLTAHVKNYRSINTIPSSILITSGAQQALHLIVQCLLKPGDSILLEDPSYHYNLSIFESAGVNVYKINVDSNGFNYEELLSQIKKYAVKMIFINPTFQNPTGYTLSNRKKKLLLDLSYEHGIPIVEDDPYSLSSFLGKGIQSIKSMDVNGNVLYISSLSKIVASGLRIGWIIGPERVIERLSDAKQQIDFGHSSFTQWIANDFLNSQGFDNHLQNLVKQLEKRRDQIVNSLNHYLEGQVEYHIPTGGIHLWCKIKHDVNELKLLEESIIRGLLYTPGFTMGSTKGYVRFTFAREQEELIDEGIRKFADALGSIKN
ncbi:PLP-dependent aminotransferase family protein [Bacillus sp. BGMRC 2118]|nr:PLP-dependent aminotransferase family protein [Bacillus sp. BGMRC 2118]